MHLHKEMPPLFSVIQWNIQDGGGRAGSIASPARFDGFNDILDALLKFRHPTYLLLNEFGQKTKEGISMPMHEPILRNFHSWSGPIAIRNHLMAVFSTDPNPQFPQAANVNNIKISKKILSQNIDFHFLHIDCHNKDSEISDFTPNQGHFAIGDWNTPCTDQRLNKFKIRSCSTTTQRQSATYAPENNEFTISREFIEPTHLANGWIDFFATDRDDLSFRLTHFDISRARKGNQRPSDHSPIMVEAFRNQKR
jgi:hypothetical protein